ncbi:MAG: radical SAM protein [Bacteroidales bacterium]|nr:radical SAM protein [Bacteroidales bacterium]
MKSKKLLLVSANRHALPYPVYPLGISYLKAYLKEQMPALEVHIFDFMTDYFDEYKHCLAHIKPDYIGISLRNIDDVNIYRQDYFMSHYKEVMGHTRKYSKAVVIIGGSGFSIYPELLYKDLDPDFGIYGEGETSLHKLLTAIENNQDYKAIEGLLYKQNGQVVFNKKTCYFETPVVTFDEPLIGYYWKNSGMLNIQTKRGCPYKCIYCTYPLIEGTTVRTLDPDKIVKTLSDLYSNHKIDYIFFTDSIFNIHNKFNYELADRMIASNLKIHWGGYFNFANIDGRLLEKLKQTGLRHIEFGTESLSDVMLKNYEKPFTVTDILNICKICNKLDIDFAHYLILGGYGETEQTLDETFENSKKMGRTVFFPYIGMRIYPGTTLQKIAIREGIVKSDDPLLEPVYYVSKNINLDTLKEKARLSGRQWLFPDEDISDILIRLRKRNKKGPLWEYLAKS